MKAEPSGLSAVIDTNVWISGFLCKASVPGRVVRHVVTNGRPVFSSDTFAELRDRLWRPKFDRYLSIEQRKGLLHDIDALAYWVNIPSEVEQQAFSRDRDDDKFIHAALAAKVSWLVSGDQDLLILADALKPRGVTILSPADAVINRVFFLRE